MNGDLENAKLWAYSGKTVGELISELETFEDKSLVVEVSIDGVGDFPISLVGKKNDKCLLMYFDFGRNTAEGL